MQWALLFEQTEARIVGQTRTLYGEKLSTVFLGLDHNYSRTGPPILFETMLFAPMSDEERDRTRRSLSAFANDQTLSDDDQLKRQEHAAYIEKHYPHDQLQLRYATDREASDRHQTLKLQCLIPPRWRHFLLWTIARDPAWSFYNDEDNDTWF
jgi:hypothetical protein